MSNALAREARMGRKTLFLKGGRDAIPLIIGGIPFGVIFGTLAMNAGLDVWQTMGMSSIVFAGSAQFVAIGMLAAGSSLGFIVAATLIVNLRHLIYAASMMPLVRHLPQKWRIPLGFLLVDEVFAATTPQYFNHPKQANNHWHYLGVGTTFFVSWNIATIVGIFFGSSVPGIDRWGLDFAMSATFIGMVVPQIVSRPMLLAVIVSGVSAVISFHWPHKLGLVFSALLGMGVGYYLEQLSSKKPAAEVKR